MNATQHRARTLGVATVWLVLGMIVQPAAAQSLLTSSQANQLTPEQIRALQRARASRSALRSANQVSAFVPSTVQPSGVARRNLVEILQPRRPSSVLTIDPRRRAQLLETLTRRGNPRTGVNPGVRSIPGLVTRRIDPLPPRGQGGFVNMLGVDPRQRTPVDRPTGPPTRRTLDAPIPVPGLLGRIPDFTVPREPPIQNVPRWNDPLLDIPRPRFPVVGPNDRLVFYLHRASCSDVTDGGPIEIGDDQLTMAYAVVVTYDDGTYRAWGDYLYHRFNVDEDWHTFGGRMEKAYVAVSNLSPRMPVEREAQVAGKRIAALYIATVLLEWDPSDDATIWTGSTYGPGDALTARLREVNWSEALGSYFPEYRVHDELRRFVRESEDDVIGGTRYRFSGDELRGLFFAASRAETQDDVEQYIRYRRDLQRASVFSNSHTGDGSLYYNIMGALVGPQEAFARYLPPITDFATEEPPLVPPAAEPSP